MISSFSAHLSTVSEKKCEADFWKASRLPSAGRKRHLQVHMVWWILIIFNHAIKICCLSKVSMQINIQLVLNFNITFKLGNWEQLLVYQQPSI